jgi:S1-C subfamily serine protease
MNDEHDDSAVTRRFEPGVDDPTREIPSATPQEHLAPPRSSAVTARRRWPLVTLMVLLLAAAGLAGVLGGYAVWGMGQQTSVQEGSAGAPQVESVEEPPQRDYGAPYAGPDSDGSSGSSSTEPALDVSSIVASVSPGLVDLNVTFAYGGGQGAGTGIVLTSSGQVLTNNHVIAGASEISITSVGNGKTYSASVVGYDRSHDIALLQLSGASGLPAVSIGDSSAVGVGDGVVVIGNAGGDGGEPSADGGVVTALDQRIDVAGPNGMDELLGLIEVRADVQQGQSGGPTVNSGGEVIGITTAASASYRFDRGAGGTGFAIPINQALAIVEKINGGQSTGTVHVGPTAFLGVQVSSSADPRGYGGGNGAIVSGVLADTPAEAAGLQRGDVITSFGGSSVDSATALTELIGRCSPGDRAALSWVDQSGREHTATVTLIQGPPG